MESKRNHGRRGAEVHTCRQQRVTDAMRTIGGYGHGRQRQRRMPAASVRPSVRPSARPRVRRSRLGQRWMAATCVIPVCVGRRRGNFSRSWPAQAGRSGPNRPVSISPSPSPTPASRSRILSPLSRTTFAPRTTDDVDAKPNDRRFAQLPKTHVAVRSKREELYRRGRRKSECVLL